MSGPLVSYERWVEDLRGRAKDITDAQHLVMIDCFIEHMVSERSGDIDRFMRTMIPEPVYRSWGGRPRPPGVGPSVRRGAEVRDTYQRMMDRPDGFPQFEMQIERFFVGDDGLAMDGVLHRLLRGAEVIDMGEALPDGASPDGHFVHSRRMALFVSFEDGLMVGEDMYNDSTATVTPAEAG
jgi:hypothetical protein